ncbi:hypothetical protein Tcan_16058 [Toxocara canis]|uniref:Uncharacterized protein n=1 Tax=Toxocara canis TaxID=6265 RepID=A0A0B2VJE5_TOXCA|nr:hypothetical protein Tcan_16058 [Toxocara canis]
MAKLQLAFNFVLLSTFLPVGAKSALMHRMEDMNTNDLPWSQILSEYEGRMTMKPPTSKLRSRSCYFTPIQCLLIASNERMNKHVQTMKPPTSKLRSRSCYFTPIQCLLIASNERMNKHVQAGRVQYARQNAGKPLFPWLSRHWLSVF